MVDIQRITYTLASDTKGASHTPATEAKGASNTELSVLTKGSKGVSHTQVSGPTKGSKEAGATQEQRNKAGKKGTSNTQANEEIKEAQAKEVDNLNGGAKYVLEKEERVKAQIAKEQMSKTLSYLARQLSDIGGPLLSD
jgi:hypothetical protein